MDISDSAASQIVRSVSPVAKTIAGTVELGPIGIYRPRAYAPAWLYSALNWLSRTYTDGSGSLQSFSGYLFGSDVDPYQRLGSTRLFVIVRGGQGYQLSTALDANSAALLPSGDGYPMTDEGILSMYNDLAASSIFSSVRFCYVPGQTAPDTPVRANPIVQSGYDPATGLRVILQGSAVAQVVPLSDFLTTENEQVYDEHPQIVPIASSLVYDVSQNNSVGATTFALPIYYARETVGGNLVANRLATTTTVNAATVACGQTVISPGGPGYDATRAATADPNPTSGSSLDLGVCTLTFAGRSPAAIFASQQITSFYRDPSWTTSLGVPIYDYGESNAAFTSTTDSLVGPSQIYGSSDDFLNGGTLQNVLQKLMQATYLMSTDRLVELLDSAISVQGTDDGSGLSVTTAALDFTMSSSAASTVVDQLSVPLVVTVTTTPAQFDLQNPTAGHPLAQNSVTGEDASPRASTVPQPVATFNPIEGRIPLKTVVGIGTAGNTPPPAPTEPTTIQLALTATVPKSVLTATGITGIEIGTVFPEQSLGSGVTFQAEAAGAVVNLTATAQPAVAPFELELTGLSLSLVAATAYTFSLTGSALTVSGSDGSSATASLSSDATENTSLTYVGMAVYTASLTTIPLYPVLGLSLAAPVVAVGGVQQGTAYSIRLTIGTDGSTYDVVDANQTVIESGIGVATPSAANGSWTPEPGDLYFGSFFGGASNVPVWSMPVFLQVTPTELHGASFDGTMSLAADVSGLPGYQLAITDSSLFVYSNIDVDNAEIGSVSSSNVFLASAVVNSSPDDYSAGAFAPSRLLMGLVRQIQTGSELVFAFIPEDDSVVIGGIRYIVSVINLAAMEEDPNTLPYPPSYWPAQRFWQFANRHNPYLGVQYVGESESDRLAVAGKDVAAAAGELRERGEPLQLMLDTNRQIMTVWPILAFPYATSTTSIDQGQLKLLTSSILELLNAEIPSVPTPTASQLGEQILLPGAMQQPNPYTFGVTTSTNPVGENPVVMSLPATSASIGQTVLNLSPDTVPASAQAAVTTDEVALTKRLLPSFEVTQGRTEGTNATATAESSRLRTVYGFSIYSPATGEAYLVEVVGTDLALPDQLPDPTIDTTYDPYYVRVVFLNTLTSYNMSIIVPAMARDQYQYLAEPNVSYENAISKIDEFDIGYLYQVSDASGEFDELEFGVTDIAQPAAGRSYLYTNLPYRLRGEDKELDRFVAFVCRRRNWNGTCHLMLASRPEGPAAYMAFGGGDLVPMRLDAGVSIDKRQPDHMVEFSYSIADHAYDSAQAFSSGNVPYFIGVSTVGGVVTYTGFSISATGGVAGVNVSGSAPLQFPANVYVVGEATTTFANVADLFPTNSGITDTGAFANCNSDGTVIGQQFQVVVYNNLVYLIRAVSNASQLGDIGGAGVSSGLLIDTFVTTPSGSLVLAQGARFKQSGLQYFGSTYTATTMVDTLDQLDFTSITGETFCAPTIFIPIPELDSTKGFVVNLSDFLGQQVWTIVYPEVVAGPGVTVNGTSFPNGYNLDQDGKPILSLQKLHFVYDPLAVLFTPNDLTHKYALQTKQQILAISNGQMREGICWRSANPLPGRNAPSNVCAQEILPVGLGMDRTNVVYSAHNRPVQTAISNDYLGMSVNSFVSVAGTVYNIEESAMETDQTGAGFISQVSSAQNLLIGVLFDYDNDELGTLNPYDETASNKGVIFVNGYQSASGYTFSSPDHYDVNDVLPSEVPGLDEIADILGLDVSFYNIDVNLPQQFWSFSYDGFTAPGLPNYIPDVPPAPADPTFLNRTRSVVLNLRNPVRPTELGLMDTYSSVVSANLHLENGVTGAIFLNKKADRDIASIGSNPSAPNGPLLGLPTKYDFFIFSRDHYATLQGCQFELIDQGYAMALVDDGTGTGTKVAQYYVDTDGNYNELYNYVLYSPQYGILETNAFTLKVTLGSPANLNAVPPVPETPNSVSPTDLVAAINKVSNLIYAAFGAASPGQPAPYIPIQVAGGEVQSAPIMGAPGFNGYSLNVVNAQHQPVQIAQIYFGTTAYQIAGSTTTIPLKSGKAIPFYGSISHGLDKMVQVHLLTSPVNGTTIPRPTVPVGPAQGTFGGNGLGAMIDSPFSWAFQGSGAIPPAVATDQTPGTTMKADDTVFYTYDPVNLYSMDSTGKEVTAAGTQYFVDETDPANPIWVVVTLPKFTLDITNTVNVNVNTTLPDGVTSRYTLVLGGKSYLFDSDTHVTADGTSYTFNVFQDGIYAVTYAAVDPPSGAEAPTPITLTPFSMTAGGLTTVVDVFNNPGGLNNVVLGVLGRTYSYDPVRGVVTITAGETTTTAQVQTGVAFVSSSFYGYVVGYSDTGTGTGTYTVNGQPMYPYAASTTGSPATYPILTAPEMFTLGGNFYTFDQDASGNYLTVTGAGQTIPINQYQFSLDGTVYIFNTSVQPNTVIGGGNTYATTAGNTQFVIDGVQYTVTLKSGSLSGATISGQFNVTQANVIVVENFAYELDIINGQIVGNGTAYPLTTSGFTYSISTADQSYTVTTEANATTVTIAGVVYQINDTTVVGDGITHPILTYRTFTDGSTTYQIGLDGSADLPQTIALSASQPPTFSDGSTYTVNALAAFDGTEYHPITGSPASFSAAGLTYELRTDGVAFAAGPTKTYLAQSGALQPNQFSFGTETIYFGRPTDLAAFDGTNYYALAANSFTDTSTGDTYTLSGGVAINAGNSYEIYSNLGVGEYFEVPGGKTYFVNVVVADTGSASGSIYQVFPTTGSSFTIPLLYTLTVSDTSVTVAATTIASPTDVPTLAVSGGKLTGGYFNDPVTGIVYTCVVDGETITFVDSNNTEYAYSAPGTSGTFTAAVAVTTAVLLAIDSESTPDVYPVINSQFVTGTAPSTTTYTVNVPVAYLDATSGPFWPIVNGRFIVPETAPRSSVTYTLKGSAVVKGYVISDDDQFSPDGNVVYTVNAVNVVKADNEATLSGSTLTSGSLSYTLGSPSGSVSVEPTGLSYSTATNGFTVSYNGTSVTYTVAGTAVTDNRKPIGTWTALVSGSQLTFTDSVSGVTFTFDESGDNPVTAEFTYTNEFFFDPITGTTYFIDQTDNRVEAISYLPETTQSAFTATNGVTYLIDYSDVEIVFPVVSGDDVNAGVATVGTDIFSVEIGGVEPTTGGTTIPTNQNSFEINGNLYTITGAPSGANYLGCSVVGDAGTARPFLSSNTFSLGDPTIVYTLHLDPGNLPETITASFPVRASRDLISVNDNVYLITYNSTSTGTLLGQGAASIPISGSAFKLSNPFDSTTAKFVFDDLDIYDAGSVVGQFTAYLAPTFFLANATFTFSPATLALTDNSGRPYPLIPNPTMFSINGFNYVIDTNRTPHAALGNNNISPLSTDVTVQSGLPVANSTFTLNGQEYAYIEDAQHNLLAVTGTKLYPIAQPGLTFKLDSSLLFTINPGAPASGDYTGTVVPIGTVTAGSTGATTTATTVLNLYAGTNESGGSDYFMYKNVLYTLIKSASVYTAVQKTYTVYVSAPSASQQQLAVFDMAGTTYLVTDGTSAGSSSAAGINPATMWSQTAITPLETQFGLVYGFVAQPTTVVQATVNTPSGTTQEFQFSVTGASGTVTAYDILYTSGSSSNFVQVNVPDLLPSFTQSAGFTFYVGAPLTLETGGYNAFTAAIGPTADLTESYAGAFKTPLTSTDSSIDSLIGAQGDFTLEFWHSLSLTPFADYHPFTYQSSTTDPLVYYVDVDFNDPTTTYVRVNNTVMQAVTPAPAFSSRWRHFALTYDQPYTMVCNGGGYEVPDGTNYNVTKDFSIAMTFAASDIETEQTLVYKGVGSNNTTPQTGMSYRLAVHNGAVTLMLTDADGNISSEFAGPAISADVYYQVIAIKQTTTPATGSSKSSTDPYHVPLDSGTLKAITAKGGSATLSGDLSSGSSLGVSDVGTTPSPTPTDLDNFLDNLNNPPAKQSYTIVISVRQVNDDGTFGPWTQTSVSQDVDDANGLNVISTNAAHLLIGDGFDDSATEIPFGTASGPGNIRDLYLFNNAIDPAGLKSNGNPIDLAAATQEQLQQAGILGYWPVQYDPNGVVQNVFDQTAVASSTNASLASLAPLSGHELEGTSLYINGYPMNVSLVASDVSEEMPAYAPGWSLLSFNAGLCRLEEMSIWSMCRAQYQILDDMFGRIVAPNEPFLSVYLSGEFTVPESSSVALPMNKYLDGFQAVNPVLSFPFTFTSSTLDLIGSPCVGRCGPLVTPNLYTPPGVALTVCDTVPELTSYSITLNTTTGNLAGEINEAYVYVKDSVIMLYAGKKVGDLELIWVSQEQGDVQVIGFIEGAPPAPMANLTNKSSYSGATSVTISAPSSVTLKYQHAHDSGGGTKTAIGDDAGLSVGIGWKIAPFGFGVGSNKKVVNLGLKIGLKYTEQWGNDGGKAQTPDLKIEQSNKYTVKMEGTLSAYTNDQFMANLNTVTTPSTTPGTPGAKTPILPNPNLGGFTTSNPAAPLPRGSVTEEKFGQRMFVPSPYGQAFVSSQTLDVYQEKLVQSGTVYGFVAVPNAQIPRDLNVVSFRINSQYLRPGSLDGMVGYAYNPATLPDGAETYATSTGEMAPLYDANFSQGVVGHAASYMRLVEAYQIKKQIDQQSYNTLAIYNSAFLAQEALPDPTLTPALDFYDEYIWSARGATQEVKHSYSTAYEEVMTNSRTHSQTWTQTYNLKLSTAFLTLLDASISHDDESKESWKYNYTTTASESFDVTASFSGIESDTQMHYSSNNDAHFVMNFNSMFNPNNQSGVELMVGSDGLVYQIVPSVESGAGLPLSNNLDTSQTYMQPQPSYTTGNADGLTGNLESYDRPGKTNLFRTYTFFLQPAAKNSDDFWSTVIDPIWLANSPDADAEAMRSAQNSTSIPWRLMYRVTYSERFLPPVSNASVAVPQITPIMAVPVLDGATDFAFLDPASTAPRPLKNPANDIEANVVLVAPTQSGLSAGTTATSGALSGQSIPPNNVIPFDLVKSTTPIVTWGDSNNAKLLTQLVTSVLGSNLVPMSSSALPGSTVVAQVPDPVTGGTLYTIYQDPNGLTVNVPTSFGVSVFADVNGNPIQYYDGKTYHSLQADYVPSPDGTIMYYVDPPSTYDQSAFSLYGDYDPYRSPGDQWRYFLVSGMSANMTSQATFAEQGPFFSSSGGSGLTGFTIADAEHAQDGTRQVKGYVLVQGVLQYPNLNTNAETFADVLVYKAMSLLDTFPIGDPEVLQAFLTTQYPAAPFVGNDEITLVFARNITSYLNTLQQGLIPQ